MEYIIGIDAGTSITKAVLFSLDGLELDCVNYKNKIIKTKNDYCELDMDHIYTLTCKCIKDVIDRNKIDKNNIIALAITGQGDGCFLIDKNGNPLGKAILWADGRAAKIVKKWQEKEIDKLFFSINGSVLFSGSMASILKYLDLNDDGLLSRANWALYCEDFLNYKFTGSITTDESNASHPFFNIRERKYSKDILELLGLVAYKKLFPKVNESNKNISTLTKEAAKELGLIEGLPVITGPFDVIATALGVGSINAGEGCSIIGTTSFNQIIQEKPVVTPFNVGFTLCFPDNKWSRAMAPMAGSPNLDWALDKLDIPEKNKSKNTINYKELEKKLDLIPAASEGIIYHPFILTSGERAPFVNSFARAQFFGLSEHHTVYHLVRAVYEGIGYSLLDSYTGLPAIPKNIRLAGGGAKSNFLCQLIADMTGLDVITMKGSEQGAKGAVVNAMVALKIYNSYNECIKSINKVNKIYKPDLENNKIYKDFYKQYVNIYKNIWDNWEVNYKLLENYVNKEKQ